MFKITLYILKVLFHLFKFISVILLFLALFMMFVWMSAVSNHFLGVIESFFNNIINFTKLIYDGQLVLFNTTFDLTYAFSSVIFIILSYLCVQITKFITKTEDNIIKFEQKTKLKEEILINKELEKAYKQNILSENRFIVKIILKESETFKEITFDDSHLFIRRLLKLIKKQDIAFDYRENIKSVSLTFENFEDIDKVIKCIDYWAKNLLETDYAAIILLDKSKLQNDFNKISKVISSGKIITDSVLMAKYKFLQEQSFNISSEGTYIINNSEIELFRFN